MKRVTKLLLLILGLMLCASMLVSCNYRVSLGPIKNSSYILMAIGALLALILGLVIVMESDRFRSEKAGVGCLLSLMSLGFIAICFFAAFEEPPIQRVPDPTATYIQLPTLPPEPEPSATPNPAESPTPSPTPLPTSASIGTTQIRPIDGAVMVYVSSGPFIMGSTDHSTQGGYDARPVHIVYLDAFWIDKTEVTNAQYLECVEAGVCQAPPTPKYCQWQTPDYDERSYANYPVDFVTWEDAQTYANWVGGRLPTEAEWEKAARGTDGRIYPWGDDYDCHNGNFGPAESAGCDGYPATSPVGEFPEGASPYGVLDMAGNVMEWVADWYSADYYSVSPEDNPQGPESGDSRVMRGGAGWGQERHVRCASRYWATVGSNCFVGFRVVMDAAPVEP